MQTSNDYSIEVMNGEIGIVVSKNEDGVISHNGRQK